MSTSKLDSSKDRFLSLNLQYALEENWITPGDVCEEFPPPALMNALEPDQALRSKLLIEACGVHEKIAPKKSITAAAEDLSLALDEGVCTPETVLGVVTADELVRYLDKDQIWELVIRDQFWLESGSRPQKRMQYMIEAALAQDLLDLHRLIRSVTPEQLCKDLPRDLLEKALTTALHAGLDDSAFEPSVVLETLGLGAWLEHLPLSHFWDNVVKGEIALTASPSGGRPPKTGTPPPIRTKSATLVGSPAPPPPSGSDAEGQARQRALQNLSAIDRLPSKAGELRTPILLGLDSMYADLLSTEDDEDRADRIREAFPNPAMLQEALYAMAQTLDPRLTEEALQERGADVNSIIQLVLFEERRRANRQAGISPSAPPPPLSPPSASPPPTSDAHPAPSGAVAPPLPPQARKASVPPPPLPAQARSRAR